MDAPQDRDLLLQRESSDFIKDLKTKLPSLLWKHPESSNRQPHRWAKSAKTHSLIDLIEPFQEWPQLLDSQLHWLLGQLTEAFMAYLAKHRGEYASTDTIRNQDAGIIYPLPRAICKLLYVLCKVRGAKAISRFLINEPKYLEPMLCAFIEWDSVITQDPSQSLVTGQGIPLQWEERHVMLLWLSHLLLAPFDLASISSDTVPIPYDNLSVLSGLSQDLPQMALSVLSISLKYSILPGKEREAATTLLTRLALRLDMQRLGVLDSLIKWAISSLHPDPGQPVPPEYACIGILSFIAKLGVLTQVEDLAPFVGTIFDEILQLVQGDSAVSKAINSSASARKLAIKIIREMTTLSMVLEEKSNKHMSSEKVSMILEDAIDHFLIALADKDTPVRFAASKALSMITLKLDPTMASDVIDAVIGSLDEDILYENKDGSLIPQYEAQSMEDRLVKRNISAVDSQKWHGLILTLGHLLFRRSPPPSRLLEVVQSLVSGLDFEQRSSTGASIGSSVRDGSCFGIWSVARKYSTDELRAVKIRDVKAAKVDDQNLLQVLAVELVCAACLDPAGNIRRGASAALQELIGRHPDTILEGIPLIQVVDYHGVARRSRAMNEVAKGASAFGNVYWDSLLDGLLGWRGIGSPDSRSRRAAASAIGELSLEKSYESICDALDRILHYLPTLSSNAVEAKHGAFLALSATVDAFINHRTENTHASADDGFINEATDKVYRLWEIFDSPLGPTVESLTLAMLRPDLTAEATSCLISSLARSCTAFNDEGVGQMPQQPSEKHLQKALDILLLCIPRREDNPIKESSKASSDLFALLTPDKQLETIQQLFKNIHSNWKSATGQGQITALGAVFKHIPVTGGRREYVINELIRCTRPDETMIAKRISAVNCITTGILLHTDDLEGIAENLRVFLNDYTVDRRGDIGSFIRVEAIGGVNTILESRMESLGMGSMHNLMICIVRLAAEKLDKVRFPAWKCLQTFWESATDLPPFQMRYDHFSDMSSPEYFSQLLTLLQVDWLRRPLLKGLVTSISAGTEGVVRASRLSIVQYIHQQDKETRRTFQATIFDDLLSIFEDIIDDDRYAIPLVDSIAFLLENYLLIDSAELEQDAVRKLFRLVQKYHFRSANIPRIETSIKVYAVLLRYKCVQKDVTKKVTGLLLHPYPKIRLAAVICLFMETGHSSLRSLDWTQPPKELKTEVDSLRQALVN